MRSWERKDIVDVLLATAKVQLCNISVDAHRQLQKASIELADGGDHEGASELDDECIVIEQFIESNYDIEWDGLKFSMEKVDKS